jgi:hypothetical protein
MLVIWIPGEMFCEWVFPGSRMMDQSPRTTAPDMIEVGREVGGGRKRKEGRQ